MPEGGPTPTVKTANLDGAGRPPAHAINLPYSPPLPVSERGRNRRRGLGPQARIPFGARLGSGLRTESSKRFQGLWDSPLLTRAHDARGVATWLWLLVCVRINEVSRTSQVRLTLIKRHKKRDAV